MYIYIYIYIHIADSYFNVEITHQRACKPLRILTSRSKHTNFKVESNKGRYIYSRSKQMLTSRLINFKVESNILCKLSCLS